MTRPESTGHAPRDAESVAALGELALLPKPSLTEQVRLTGRQNAMPLITQTSFRTHQDTSEKYGRRIAFSAWYSLNTCVPGTKAARTLEDKISHRTPDFSSQAVRLKDSETIIGFVPVLFPLVVEAAVQRQEFIPNMGPTATGFLLDLAEVVQAELDASE